MEDTRSKNMILWFFLALFIVSCLLLGWLLLPFLSILVMAAVVTGLFNPLFNILKKKLKPALASLLTCFLAFFTRSFLSVPSVPLARALISE